MSLVIDASVAAKWLFPEEGSDAADALLEGEEELLAPELIYFEIGNIVWKRCVAGRLSIDLGREVMNTFVAIPLVFADLRPLAELTLQISTTYGRTFYDSSYLALAVARGCALLTADERLANSLAGTELGRHIRRF